MPPVHRWIFALVLALSPARAGFAQDEEKPIQVFGYFQNVFQHEVFQNGPDNNSFAAQQLNLFFQKDISHRFRSFINFEFLNNFSSSEAWGAANLKEAWIRYDHSPAFKLKLGLQTPVFNHLNEIKTRTPLLPYIVRPIVYETSLEDVIRLDEYVPERGFLQAYGTLALGRRHAFDYALFAGNSPNIRTDRNLGQTGVDTTTNVLVGGRLGVRLNEWVPRISEIKAGVSVATDRVNYFRDVGDMLSIKEDEIEQYRAALTMVPRTRVGVDVSVYLGRLYLEAEGISALFQVPNDLLDLHRVFGYATLGYVASERLEFYVSYWRTDEDALIVNDAFDPTNTVVQRVTLDIPTAGVRYVANERVVFKAQIAYVDLRRAETFSDEQGIAGPTTARTDQRLTVFALGASVFF
ncbi:MAG: hypothetical protein SH809_13180 [Rhodothermales bacterium]|nr:hypothetical protein [Rhodothermales bacterium]